MTDYLPKNQEKDPLYNAEPGIAIVPGSNYQKYMQTFEQLPQSKYALGEPGNPYVYRPYPKMLYRAQRPPKGGAFACSLPQPDAAMFSDPRDLERAEQVQRKFDASCQRIVGDETERSRAMEDGWRESPGDAVSYMEARETDRSTAAAHRNYEDRNMSEPAKREIEAAQAQTDGHLAEVPRKRGRPRKQPAA
jgi:hypothetical protein